jgi:hypothetical protein
LLVHIVFHIFSGELLLFVISRLTSGFGSRHISSWDMVHMLHTDKLTSIWKVARAIVLGMLKTSRNITSGNGSRLSYFMGVLVVGSIHHLHVAH